MNNLNSPVRYYGGKGNGLRWQIYDYFPDKSQYNMYIEPFGGGANLLFAKEAFGIEIYNDLEQNVYSLFKVISDKKLFPQFKEKCDLALYSADLREEYIEDLKIDGLDVVERAYKYFYVNRTSMNGNGGFGVAPCIRRNMSKSVSDFLSAIDALPELHNRLSKVIIENTDGIGLIEKYDKDDVFIYADPPYHHDTRTTARYKVDMNDESQDRLLKALLNTKKTKILLSGYDCSVYNKLVKKGWKQVDIIVKTTDTHHKPKEKIETLWMNYDIEDKQEINIFDN